MLSDGSRSARGGESAASHASKSIYWEHSKECQRGIVRVVWSDGLYTDRKIMRVSVRAKKNPKPLQVRVCLCGTYQWSLQSTAAQSRPSRMDQPTIDTRLNYNGYLGTIKYVGPVDGTKDIWLGIEWDDPQRGKHGGTKDGKVYFTCW